MKKSITLILSLLFIHTLFAQTPQSFRYQAVARDNSGAVLANQLVSFRISILSGSAGGTAVYSETHSGLITNAFGLVELEIGKGTPVTGTFSAINWGSNSYFVKVEMDPAGSSAYQELSTSQLLSVPYALHAKTVETGDNWGMQSVVADATLAGNGTSASNLKLAQQSASSGQVLKWNGTTWRPGDDNGSLWQQSGNNIYYDNGSVGIGTANPQRLLHLNTASVYSGIMMTNDASGSAGTDGLHIGLQYQADAPSNRYALILNRENTSLIIGTNNNNAGDLNILPGGNIGLGTSTPSTRLDVNGQIRIRGGSPGTGKILTSDAVGLASWESVSIYADPVNFSGDGSMVKPIKLNSMGASAGQVLKWNGVFWDSASDDTGPWSFNDNYIYNSSSKKFGIGINVPTRKLTIAEPTTSCYMNLQNSTTGYAVNAGMLIGMDGNNGWLTTYEPGNLYLGNAGTARITIDPQGDLGIGTSVPAYKLDVTGSVNIGGTGDVKILCDGQEALWYNGTYYSWGYGGSYNYFADNVTIGSAAVPGYNLVVNGTAAKTGGGSWSTLSDLRLKDLKGDYLKGLNEILQLKPVMFTYKPGNPREISSSEEQIGFVAQEVQKVFPEAVNQCPDGYLDFNMHAINVALVNAIKELKTENDLLKKRIEQIEALTGYNVDK